MSEYLASNYSFEAIKGELHDSRNIYHIIYADGQAVGFSKIVMNATYPGIAESNTSKLDRIYLLKEFHREGLGTTLLQFNIELSRQHNQSAMWLFTWIGNHKAVAFYQKAGFMIIGSHDFKVTDRHYNPNYHMLLKY
jgi:ribosomal protein S18 acetylase RimI-like enzyme